MRWPGVTSNLYQRALPAESMKSRAVAVPPVSVSALGQKSLSPELTRQADAAVADGAVTRTVTKLPGVTPDTVAPKYPSSSVVTKTAAPAGVPPPGSAPALHVGAVDAVSVRARFDAPSTRPITKAPVPPVEATRIKLGVSSGGGTS